MDVGKICVICGEFFQIHFIGGEHDIFCPECIKRMRNLKDILYSDSKEDSICDKDL